MRSVALSIGLRRIESHFSDLPQSMSKYQTYLIFGAPGSGKGTQSEPILAQGAQELDILLRS
jgi:KaiC/GvpD/RAD55 family RecA-like ATPase